MRAILLLLLTVTACEGCATVSVPPIPYDTGTPYLARTGCDPTDERKVTDYEPEYEQGTVMHDEIRAHEMKHQEQISRYGCQVWLVIYKNDAGFRLRSEAEAMCAQVPVAMARYGMSRDAAVDRYAGWLLGAYPREVESFANARGMIQYYCKERT